MHPLDADINQCGKAAAFSAQIIPYTENPPKWVSSVLVSNSITKL